MTGYSKQVAKGRGSMVSKPNRSGKASSQPVGEGRLPRRVFCSE